MSYINYYKRIRIRTGIRARKTVGGVRFILLVCLIMLSTPKTFLPVKVHARTPIQLSVRLSGESGQRAAIAEPIPEAEGTVSVADESKTELIFLLDSSQSMEKIDPQSGAADFIKEIDLSLPGNYRTGLVTYQAEVARAIRPDRPGQSIAAGLAGTEYGGYSNTGAGLKEAMELFSADPTGNRKILLITDGEIDMPTAAETEAARELFDQTVTELREQGITVDVVAIDNPAMDADTRTEDGSFRAATATGGRRYSAADIGELPELAAAYLFDRCLVPAAAAGKLSGEDAELSVELPDTLMNSAKIFLFGRQPHQGINVSGKAGAIRVEQGAGFTVITLDKPLETLFTVRLSAQDEAGTAAPEQPSLDITAYLTAEYTIALTAGNRYRPESGTAVFDLDIVNPEGRSLMSGHLKDQNITVLLDGKESKAVHEGGRLQVTQAVSESGPVRLRAVLPETYAYYEGIPEAEDTVEVPPPPEEPGVDYFLLTVILVLAASFAALFIWVRKKRHRYPYRRYTHTGGDNLPPEPDSYGGDFWGKVTVYVINSGDGIDYHPETVNLAAKCSKDTASLQWLLDTCGLPLVLRDADRIIFRPGEGKSLLVKNSSRATVLKRREVLERFHSYPMHFKEKLTVIFDHDSSAGEEPAEIEIHYQDLKLNER